MRAPDVVLEPAHLLEVLDRAAAEEALAVLLLLDGLGEVGVEPQPEAPRELGGLPHQPLRDRERRAGRDDDLRPRAGAGLVEGEKALRVGEHLVGVLDEVVRRQAAVGLAHVHRAARGDEPDAELARSLDLRLDEPLLAARKDVVVVERGRAAAEGQRGETGAGGGVLGIAVDPAPERIELAEPAEEVGLLRPRPREGLVEVVVRVDEAGRDECAAQVLERLRGRRIALAHLDDEAVVDEDPAVGELGAGVVHRDDVGVREQGPHERILSCWRA